MGPILGFAFRGRKYIWLAAAPVARPQRAVVSWWTAGTDAGGELRSGQGQAKGRPAPGRRGGDCPGLDGLRRPRMRDKALSLTPFTCLGEIGRNGPSKQGSVAELGHSGGKYQPHGLGEGAIPPGVLEDVLKSTPRARGRSGGP